MKVYITVREPYNTRKILKNNLDKFYWLGTAKVHSLKKKAIKSPVLTVKV